MRIFDFVVDFVLIDQIADMGVSKFTTRQKSNLISIQFELSASDSSAMVDQLNRDPLDIELVLFGGDIRQYIYIYISNLINNKTLIVMFYFGNVVTRMAIRRRALTTCGINGDSSFNAMFVLSISLLKICNNYISFVVL